MNLYSSKSDSLVETWFVLAYNKAWGEFEIKDTGNYCGDNRLKFLGLRPKDEISVVRNQERNQAGGINTNYFVYEFLTVENIKRDFDSRQRD